MDTSIIQSQGVGSPVTGTQVASQELTLGKQDFLKLLVAQLAHQDPMQPMENTEFVAQLAQFSSLEQLMQANQNLGLIQTGQMAIANSQLAGLIGKEVEVNGSTLNVTQQGTQSFNFNLGAQAGSVKVTITDSQGAVVRTLELGSRSAGTNTATWDGKNTSGNLVATGTYTLQVTAKDAAGKDVTSSLKIKGNVSGVTYVGGVPLLEVGGTTVKVGDVTAVRQPTQSAPTGSNP